jgi:uncharacterized protein YndB with AHSA1/START domain
MDDRDDRVTRSAEIDAPPERVWEALTGAEELSAWFGAEADGVIEVGERIRFRWEDGRERVAVIEERERPRKLAFRWLPFERYPGGETRILGPGRVEFELEPHEGGARIRVVELGTPERLPSVGRSGPVFLDAVRAPSSRIRLEVRP